MLKYTINPNTKAKFSSKTETHILFEDGAQFIIHNGTPILFGKDSIFNESEILTNKTTTQDAKHLDTKNFKNFVRRKLLPSLCDDFDVQKRYETLSKRLTEGSKVLILGTGEKKHYYKNLFPHCEVITSDVHNSFQPDFVFDGHAIPFQDECFDMVLAAQVIEHTGMRSLFPKCEVVESSITEGNASIVAVTISNYLVNVSSIGIIRSGWLFVTRILLGWMKYLDKLQPHLNKRTVSMPKGYAFTFKKDTVIRKPNELLNEFYKLKK